MVYETTIDGEDFFPFIKSATDFVGDAKVIFDDYVLISSLDTAGVLLVDTAVRNPNPPSEPIEVILDLRSIAGITSVKKDVTFVLDGSSRVKLKTGRMEYTLPTIIEPHLKDRKMPEKVFPVRLSMKAEAFVDGVNGMIDASEAIEETNGFWFTAPSAEEFYFQDQNKQLARADFIYEDEFTAEIFDEPAISMFSIDYLKDMVKHIKKFDDIKVCLGNSSPMIVICTNDNRKLAYAVANRMHPND